MAQPPPPYGAYPPRPPYPPPYPPPRAPKPRPSGWWFVLGGALLAAAVVAAVGLFLWTLSGFFDTEAQIEPDGRPHDVTVGTGSDRMLWLEDGFGQECRIVDRTTGAVIPLEPVGPSYHRSDGTGDWHGAARFDPGSGELEVTCRPSEGAVFIGVAPRIGSFVLGILATILVPLFLGLSGLVVLIVTGILFGLRSPRRPGPTAPR